MEESKETDHNEQVQELQENEVKEITKEVEMDDTFKLKIEQLRNKLNTNKSKTQMDLQISKTNYLAELSKMGKYPKLREVIEMMQPQQNTLRKSYRPIKLNTNFLSHHHTPKKLYNTFPKKDHIYFHSNNSDKINELFFYTKENFLERNKTTKEDTFIAMIKSNYNTTRSNRYNNMITSQDRSNRLNSFKKKSSFDSKYNSKRFYSDQLNKFSLRLFGNGKFVRKW